MSTGSEFDEEIEETFANGDYSHIRQCSDCQAELRSYLSCKTTADEATQYTDCGPSLCPSYAKSLTAEPSSASAEDSHNLAPVKFKDGCFGTIKEIMRWNVSEWNLQNSMTVLNALKVNAYIVRPNFILSANIFGPLNCRFNMDTIFEQVKRHMPSWAEIEPKFDVLLQAFDFKGCKSLADVISDEHVAIPLLAKLIRKLQRQERTLSCIRPLRIGLQNLKKELMQGSLVEYMSRQYFCDLFGFFQDATGSADLHLHHMSLRPLTLMFDKSTSRKVTLGFYATCRGNPFLVGEFKKFEDTQDRDGATRDRKDESESIFSRKRSGGVGLLQGGSDDAPVLKKAKTAVIDAAESEDLKADELRSMGDSGDGKPKARGCDGVSDSVSYSEKIEESCGYRNIRTTELHKVTRYLPELLAEMLASLDQDGGYYTIADILSNEDPKHGYNVHLGLGVDGFKLRFVRLVLCENHPRPGKKPSVQDLRGPDVKCQVFLTKEMNLFHKQHLKLFFKYLYGLAFVSKYLGHDSMDLSSDDSGDDSS